MINNQKPITFYFHDYETFGKHPALDRPAQFAGVRTDAEFNIIEEPLVIYCRPSEDYLPDPEAVMITGITPQQALSKGINEVEFARQIHAAFTQPNCCIIGYNNIRFDDEISRHLFYRNFIDPYAYSWQNGNSRWDLLDVVRACYALRPEGIEWPENDEGLPSFKLTDLTEANQIAHENAHDAMSDVYATIAMAKRVKEAQPRLFNYLFQSRDKQSIIELFNIADMTPLVHVSGMFGAYRHNISLIAPIAWHPGNKNAVITCDLAGDISTLIQLDKESLYQRLYTHHHKLMPDQSPIPLKLVHTNKCPVIAPIKTLRAEDSERLNIDVPRCLANLELLRQHPEIREKVIALYYKAKSFPVISNVDAQLYQGFFNHADRAAIQIIAQTKPQNLPALTLNFNDPRLSELLFRFRARNYPATLNDSEQQRWRLHCQDQLTPERVQNYVQILNELTYQYEHQSEKLSLVKALFEYGKRLIG